jgi:hypothetical protein
MRTTLTLDKDVAAALKRVLSRRRDGLKAVVNEALRIGLRQLNEPAKTKAHYRTPSVDLGRCLVPSLDDIEAVLAQAEGDRHT